MGHHSARQAAKKDLQGKRQQISSLMLRPGHAYPGKTTRLSGQDDLGGLPI